jgi:hypothetical protein
MNLEPNGKGAGKPQSSEPDSAGGLVAWLIPSRNALIGFGLFLASPFVLWTFDGWWTSPRVKEASTTFEKRFTAGLSVAELESKAKELDADRFQVFGDATPPAAVVRWNAYHLWPAKYICVVPLNDGKAVSIKCYGDFL